MCIMCINVYSDVKDTVKSEGFPCGSSVLLNLPILSPLPLHAFSPEAHTNSAFTSSLLPFCFLIGSQKHQSEGNVQASGLSNKS